MNNRIIFLDTCVFESENFFKSRNINLLFELAKQKLIEIKITDIVYRELLNHLRSKTIESINLIKKQKINLDNEARILKNLKAFDNYFDYIDIKKLKQKSLKEIEIKLNDIISENNIEIVDTSIANITEVVNDYFSLNPPFREGKKKSEFPDAISISTIKIWCQKNSQNCLHISNDKDFAEIKNPNIDFSYGLSTLLELLYKENDDVQFEFLSKIYDKELPEIEFALSSYFDPYLDKFESLVYEDIDSNPIYDDVDINFNNIEDINIDLGIINEVSEDEFTYEIEIDLIFSVDVEFTDYSTGYYDKEDGIWFGEDRVSDRKKYKANILIYPSFDYDSKKFDGQYIDIVDFEIRGIEEI